MAQIVILGAGLMGTAFSTPLADNGHDIRLVGTHLDGDIIEEIHESRVHPRLQASVAAAVQPYTIDRLPDAMDGADLVVLGVNSFGVTWASEMLAKTLPPDVPILMLTKGLVGDEASLRIFPDLLRRGLPAAFRDQVRIAAVGGPSIAGELAARRHTCVVLTGTEQALLDQLAGWLRTPYYHIWTSTDLVGVEAAVALKNIYALAVGLVNGFLERDGTAAGGAIMWNLASAIYAQGLREMLYMVDYLGGQQESVIGLPGAGDLYVTSMGGRNGRMGRWLGLGLTFSEAKATKMPDDTIEGAQLAQSIGPTVESLIAQGLLDGSKLPLMRTMIDIVCHDAPAEIPWDAFFGGAR